MAVFQPRNRVQILREMVARVISRSKLVGLTRNSVVFHVLAAAANEDAEQYVQMARLRNLFSIDRATGSDLDERAAEVLPGTIFRRSALFASGTVIFSRPGTVGTVVIPVGTQVSATDADGQIRFRTTVAGTIPNGSSSSAAINIVATTAGIRANVAAGAINRIVTTLAGVSSVTNGADFENGVDRESDATFRARVKSWVQAISRGTPNALIGFAVNVILDDGRRVLFASVVEPAIPNGQSDLYIDDGTGNIEEFDETFISSPEVILTALGGEQDAFTTNKPIRDDGSFVLEIDTGGGFTTLTRGTDYELNAPRGQVELSTTVYPTGLTAGDQLRATYRYYIGLIAATQQVIDGDVNNAIAFPGVRGAGTQVNVLPPATVFQTVTASIAVLEDFDTTTVATNVAAAIQDYINNLNIGDDVIRAEIIERAMSVEGMFNFTLSAPSADQVILSNQVARITSGSITLT